MSPRVVLCWFCDKVIVRSGYLWVSKYDRSPWCKGTDRWHAPREA